MTIEELFNLVVPALAEKISQSDGLMRFAFRRAKFEGWLKVELIDTLVKNHINALPEIDRIDVSFEHVAIELKTVNTNIAFQHVANLTRPITKNTASIIEDIICLREKLHADKFVLFVAFPINHTNPLWQVQLQRINQHLAEIRHHEFYFKNDVPGVIYIGKVV